MSDKAEMKKEVVPVPSSSVSRRAVLIAAAVSTLTLSGCVGSSDADRSISIIAPDDGAAIEADQPVEVRFELTGATVTSEGAGHVHVMVDGEVESMVSSMTAEITMVEGEHVIMAEYVDADHKPFDPPVTDSIEVTAR